MRRVLMTMAVVLTLAGMAGAETPNLDQAQWIGMTTPASLQGQALLPAVYLRKGFTLDKPVKEARLVATALGLYEFSINGRRVGNDVLAPGWTEYAKHIYYRTYDITRNLRTGDNVIGAALGDGWYGLHHKGRGRLRLRAALWVTYDDGTREIIATDGTWRATMDGPVRASDIYDGETYDARREMPGWTETGFDDRGWQPVVVGLASEKDKASWTDVTAKLRAAVKDGKLRMAASNNNFGDPILGTPKVLVVKYRADGRDKSARVKENEELRLSAGTLEIIAAKYGADSPQESEEKALLQPHPGEPVRRTREMVPISVSEPKPGNFVFDMGQNFAGWARLKVSGPAGTQVKMRFAEMLNDNGTIYTENLRGADATDRYTLKGDGMELWEPRFTFHGFRYVEVTGYPGTPAKDALTGVVTHTDMKRSGYFECSNPMLNQLFSNILWGMRSNYLEVPTDCPQRDERMGWTGDAQAFVGAAAYLYDVQPFFTAWLNTLNDAQTPDGAYPNVAPKGWGVSPAWGDAGIICPWTIWQRYGDTDVIRAHYDNMKRWIAYLEKRSKNLVRPAEGFGDWLNVKDPTPKEVISTAYFAHSTQLLSQMAAAIGEEADAKAYEDLFGRIRLAFQKAFVKDNGRIRGDSQTAYLLGMAFGLLTDDQYKKAGQRLVELVEKRDGHLSVGFLGVNILMPTLTAIDRLDLAYGILEKETYPSWGYSIAQGATTIWERWNSYTKEHGFGDAGMNSFNHYTFGSVGEWMMNTVAGIVLEGPGVERIVIRPRPGGSLTYVKASYDSVRGRIVSNWAKTGDGLVMNVTIPEKAAKASVVVPATRGKTVLAARVGAPENLEPTLRTDTSCTYTVAPGSYTFQVK